MSDVTPRKGMPSRGWAKTSFGSAFSINLSTPPSNHLPQSLIDWRPLLGTLIRLAARVRIHVKQVTNLLTQTMN